VQRSITSQLAWRMAVTVIAVTLALAGGLTLAGVIHIVWPDL
jgi:hypothetical protein